MPLKDGYKQAETIRRERAAGSTWVDLQTRHNISVATLARILGGKSYLAPDDASKPDINPWPPARVKAILDSKKIDTNDLATMLGITERAARSYIQPENSVRYRRPRGAVAKQLESLEWEIKHRLHTK